MKIGITASQQGMTEAQKKTVKKLLTTLLTQDEKNDFRHGDCIGGDAQAHAIVLQIKGVRIWIHPSTLKDKRAYCKGAFFIAKPKPPLDRNKDIVDEVTDLLVAPKSDVEELRSGTWATYRYAKKKNRKVYVIGVTGNILEAPRS